MKAAAHQQDEGKYVINIQNAWFVIETKNRMKNVNKLYVTFNLRNFKYK